LLQNITAYVRITHTTKNKTWPDCHNQRFSKVKTTTNAGVSPDDLPAHRREKERIPQNFRSPGTPQH
jgi:hypothetical protein